MASNQGTTIPVLVSEGGARDTYDFASFESAMRAISEGNAPKPSPEYSIFRHYAAGTFQLKTADIRFSKDQFLQLPGLSKGLTLIKSPKGTGKTHYLIHALKKVMFTHGEKANDLKWLEEETDSEEPYHTSNRVLLIGHRQALIRELCQRLGLNCYLDDPMVWRVQRGESQEEGRYVSPVAVDKLPRYGVCLDSLWRVKDQTYDLILIDESEQVLSHFLSDTIGEDRYELFEQLKGLISKSTSVVALDADLGWATANTLIGLCRHRDPKTKPQRLSVYVNEWAKAGDPIHLYVTRDQLFHKLSESLAKHERIFLASNSKTKVKALRESIAKLGKKLRRRLKIITITSENSKTTEVQKFITNIKREIRNYDVVLTSPSLGTGVDITFENNAREIDSVYGVFENLINTHTEIDQQLARVRHPKSVHVWISPQQFDFNTDLVIGQTEFRNNNFNAVTYAAYCKSEDEEDPFITMAATVVSFQRASKNRLKRNFIEYKTEAGWSIVDVPYDQSEGKAGRKFYTAGLKIVTEEAVKAVLNATPMSRHELADFLNRWESNFGEISLAEKYSYYRDRIEKFYGAPVTAELIEQDDQGSLREKVRIFEAISSVEYYKLLVRNRTDYWKDKKAKIRGELIVRNWVSTRILLYELFSSTPVFRNGRFSLSRVIQSSDLAKFVQTVRRHKPFIETHLGLSVTRDLDKKPVQMLSKFLKKVGLTHWRFRPKVLNGRKTYSYCVCPKRHALMRDICETRAKAASRNRSEPVIFGQSGDLGNEC